MKLIVGLGNPGKQYERTKHNIGFMALDKIALKYNLKFNKEKFSGSYAETIINGEKIIFLKPLKYINLSGEVIKKYVDYYKIGVEDILIIHDDLDLPLGKIKLKLKGGSGGHNGLKNIELNLKTKQYKRLKIGISNNKTIDTKDYVLGSFTKESQIIIDQSLKLIPNILNDYFIMNFEQLMSKYNG